MKRQPREINSLEMFTLLKEEKRKGEEFAQYQRLTREVYVIRLDDGREFFINDDPPTTNRNRSIEELRRLHLTEEEWSTKLAGQKTPPEPIE